MGHKVYQKGDIIFRQGDAGETMYGVLSGKVGIYLDYGTEKEHLLTELGDDAFFGEMGMIDHAARSATAVALRDKTKLTEVTEQMLGAYFRENPARILAIMGQMSKRLRELTKDYMEACRTAAGLVRIEEKKEEVTPEETGALMKKAEYYSCVRLHGHYLYI